MKGKLSGNNGEDFTQGSLKRKQQCSAYKKEKDNQTTKSGSSDYFD